MEHISLYIYLYLVVSHLAITGLLSSVFFSVATGMISAFQWDKVYPSDIENNTQDYKIFRKTFGYFTKSCIITVIFLLVTCLIPTKEEIAWIVGGSVAYNLSQTEEAQKLPENTLKALNSFLEGVTDKAEE